MAAEVPSSTKKRVNIQPRSNWLQLQLVVKSACSVPTVFSPNVVAAAEHSGTALPSAPKSAPCSGFQTQSDNPLLVEQPEMITHGRSGRHRITPRLTATLHLAVLSELNSHHPGLLLT